MPVFSKGQIDTAGRILATGSPGADEYDAALDVLNNWRSSHSFPLNTMQIYLRSAARRFDNGPLIAQRLKRTPSIIQKLQRFPKMQLSRMQDMGGCRAVLRNVERVRALREYYRKSSIKHQLVREDDYIAKPKKSGYRGIHLVYRYFSDKNDTYNGLQIEIQMRSRLQHAWATAVETVGTFLQQSLKSSQGSDEWLQFFTLTGSAFALVEGTATVEGTPQTKQELVATVSEMASHLGVVEKLNAYNTALQTMEDPNLKNARYFLLLLKPAEETLTVRGYQAEDLTKATSDYLEIEKGVGLSPGAQVVLVSADSIEALRRAYPNYYLDTSVFLRYLHSFTG